MNVKMVVTDLDNTLLRTDKTISEYTISVFRKLRERGILLVFATARSLESSQEYRMLLSPDGDVVTGGCLVFAGAELLRRYYLPEPQGADLLTELCEHPSIKRVSARSMNERYSNRSEEGRVRVDFKAGLPEGLIHCSCRTDDVELMKLIAASYPDFSFLHISDEDLYDINPKVATKYNGVRILADHFRVQLSEVVAFGDDNNDIEMIRECGVGVAVANAIDKVKAVADYMCDSSDNDGIAKWIEANLL